MPTRALGRNRLLLRNRGRHAIVVVRSSAGDERERAEQAETRRTDGGWKALALIGLAGAGCVDTSYLLSVKAKALPLVCTTAAASCADVLDSRYGSILGGRVPLPALGVAGYAALLTLAAALVHGDGGGRSPRRAVVVQMLASVSSAMAGCSVYLMSVLVLSLRARCDYCVASAVIAAASVALVHSISSDGRGGDAPGGPHRGGVGPTMVSGFAAGFVFLSVLQADVGGLPPPAQATGSIETSVGDLLIRGVDGIRTRIFPRTADVDIDYEAHAITTSSSARALDIARRLRETNSAMFGAFWCSHCGSQLEMFGLEAVRGVGGGTGDSGTFPYVECYPEGYHKGTARSKACDVAGVKAYPTWRIGGTMMDAGELTLDELDELLKSVEQRQEADG